MYVFHISYLILPHDAYSSMCARMCVCACTAYRMYKCLNFEIELPVERRSIEYRVLPVSKKQEENRSSVETKTRERQTFFTQLRKVKKIGMCVCVRESSETNDILRWHSIFIRMKADRCLLFSFFLVLRFKSSSGCLSLPPPRSFFFQLNAEDDLRVFFSCQCDLFNLYAIHLTSSCTHEMCLYWTQIRMHTSSGKYQREKKKNVVMFCTGNKGEGERERRLCVYVRLHSSCTTSLMTERNERES